MAKTKQAKTSHGGARPGAGRKPRAEKFAGQIAAAEAAIAKRLTGNKDGLPGLVDRMFDLAMGVTFVQKDGEGLPVVNADGGLVVYSEAPDFKAAQYLIDRIMGKPTQVQELSSPDGSIGGGVTIYMPSNGREVDVRESGDTSPSGTSGNLS